MLRPTILVTGFGPFPGAPENPTAVLLAGLAEARLEAAERDLHLELLPTRWDAARQAALRLHRALRPDIAVHFGFSLRAQGFVLERRALNRAAMGRRDAVGALAPRPKLCRGGPLAAASTLPVARIRAALAKRGLPVAVSEDAGAYVCNAVLYAAARGRPSALAGFVHMPLIAGMAVSPGQRARAGRSLAFLDRGQALEGARLILEVCAAAWRERRG